MWVAAASVRVICSLYVNTHCTILSALRSENCKVSRVYHVEDGLIGQELSVVEKEKYLGGFKITLEG